MLNAKEANTISKENKAKMFIDALKICEIEILNAVNKGLTTLTLESNDEFNDLFYYIDRQALKKELEKYGYKIWCNQHLSISW